MLVYLNACMGGVILEEDSGFLRAEEAGEGMAEGVETGLIPLTVPGRGSADVAALPLLEEMQR